MRITFTETVIYETEGPGKGPTYKSGETHDFREDIAHRWLRRDVAVLAKPEAAPVSAPETMAEAARTVRENVNARARPERLTRRGTQR